MQHKKIHPLVLGISLALGTNLAMPAAFAQDDSAEDESIEEIVSLGRLKSGAAALTDERMEVPFSADYLSFEVMSRAGDPDIAAALRRVPGLTVVDGKFVYVRGLGERYSSVTVNGAAIPSPELTRSVIPLDLFPTSLVESVKISKSPSPDQPAAFGGGSIDIRTNSIPDDLVASFSVGIGFNDESNDDGLDYGSSGSPLPSEIRDAVATYRGDISVSSIFETLNFSGDATVADAQAVQQELINSLDTNVAISPGSLDNDFGAKGALGNSWYFGSGDEWQFGALVTATYDEKARNQSQRRELIGSPGNQFFNVDRTVYEERTVGAFNTGLRWLGDHSIEASYYTIQNDENQVSIQRGFDANNQQSEGDQRTQFDTRLEERELTLVEVSGEHAFLDTPYLANWLDNLRLQDLEFEWFWTDSETTTDIPNQTTFQGGAEIDTDTGETLSESLLPTTSMGQFTFTDLEDNQNSWGGTFRLPVEFSNSYATFSAGWWGSKKSRAFNTYNVNLNSVGVQSDLLTDVETALNPSTLLVDNGFSLSLGAQFGTESYIAAQKVDAGFGMVDWTFNERWRLTAGARWEDYQQALLPIDLLDFSGVTIQNIIADLQVEGQTLAIREDDTYASLGLTFMGTGLFGADDYQFRFSYGETVVRPDLREIAGTVNLETGDIAGVAYIDPELDVRVFGNPLVKTSPIDNFEMRGEFYYADGDNFTVSLFYKDIESPIERIRGTGPDDRILLTFVNGQAGEVYGIELEGLVSLPYNLFFAGNITLSDSELTIDPNAAGASSATNDKRRLTGHSEWVTNFTLGYDSVSGRHSAFLNYNAFGERIFFGGINSNDDAFEQPFHSLGIVYKFFPTDRIEIAAKADNLLDDTFEFTQVNSNGDTATIIDGIVGLTFGVDFKYSF